MDFCTAGRLVAKVPLGRKEGPKRGQEVKRGQQGPSCRAWKPRNRSWIFTSWSEGSFGKGVTRYNLLLCPEKLAVGPGEASGERLGCTR